MNLICPECKNTIDLSQYQQIHEGMVIECATCGITLLVNGVHGDQVSVEIVDEGK